MATRKLTMEQDRAVVALMRTSYSERTGKTWVFPTDASVKLEREFNGSLDAARERTARFNQKDNDDDLRNIPNHLSANVSHDNEPKAERLAGKQTGEARLREDTESGAGSAPASRIEPVIRTTSAPVYKLFSACATKQHAHCTGAHFETDGTRVVCTCKHHRQAAMFDKVESVQAGFSFLK